MMEPVTPGQLRRAACLHGHEYGKRCLRAAADRVEELERSIRELQDVYDEGLSDDLA